MKAVPEKIIITHDEECTGCKICELVCASRKFNVNNPKKAAIRVMADESFSKFTIIICRHCEDPPCVKACLAKARRKVLDGRVIVDEGKCTKCERCYEACTYKAVFFHPEVASAILCDLCDGQPLCVRFCPTKAITFEMMRYV